VGDVLVDNVILINRSTVNHCHGTFVNIDQVAQGVADIADSKPTDRESPTVYSGRDQHVSVGAWLVTFFGHAPQIQRVFWIE